MLILISPKQNACTFLLLLHDVWLVCNITHHNGLPNTPILLNTSPRAPHYDTHPSWKIVVEVPGKSGTTQPLTRPVGYMKYFLCHSMNILFESPKNILKNYPAVVLNFSRYFSKKAVNQTHITAIPINRHFLPLTLQDCARWHWIILQETKLIFSHLQSCICDKASPALQPAETTSSSEKQQKKQHIPKTPGFQQISLPRKALRMYGAAFPVAKVRKGIYEPSCYLRSLESSNNDNKKQNFIDWKHKRNSKKQNPKPIFIISKDELEKARETRGIFYVVENHCSTKEAKKSVYFWAATVGLENADQQHMCNFSI